MPWLLNPSRTVGTVGKGGATPRVTALAFTFRGYVSAIAGHCIGAYKYLAPQLKISSFFFLLSYNHNQQNPHKHINTQNQANPNSVTSSSHNHHHD